MKSIGLHITVILMCIVCGLLGYLLSEGQLLKSEPTCVEVVWELSPYRHCIQDGSECHKSIDFYVKYYEIKHRRDSICPS